MKTFKCNTFCTSGRIGVTRIDSLPLSRSSPNGSGGQRQSGLGRALPTWGRHEDRRPRNGGCSPQNTRPNFDSGSTQSTFASCQKWLQMQRVKAVLCFQVKKVVLYVTRLNYIEFLYCNYFPFNDPLVYFTLYLNDKQFCSKFIR